MSSIIVVGHKNPDTDSVCAAISLAYLKSQMGVPCEPRVQGEPNPESKFILEKFGFSCPQLEKEATGKKIFLVDHSDISQSLENLQEGEILGLVDHHKLGDITTPKPIEIWVWPVGCTCTVLKGMYDFYKIDIPKGIAGLMLGAILSDTVIFKSATCTDRDREAAKALAEIAGIDDIQGLGLEMFKVKSAIEGTPVRELIYRDYKDFNMSGYKVGIGQLELVDLSLIEPIKEDLYRELQEIKKQGQYHSLFFMLTDIMKEGTELLVVSDDPSVLERAWGVKKEGASVWLSGVMSRKKQVVPYLEKAFASI